MRHASATGTRTRIARVRAEYPTQLDYSGSCTLKSWGLAACSCETLADKPEAPEALRCVKIASPVSARKKKRCF